jgi:hypothetical protein
MSVRQSVTGLLIALVDAEGGLDMRYHQVNAGASPRWAHPPALGMALDQWGWVERELGVGGGAVNDGLRRTAVVHAGSSPLFATVAREQAGERAGVPFAK